MQIESADRKRDYWLVTGSTGLVGEYLLKDLLLAGFKLALVVRPTKRLTARQRVEAILQRWESELEVELPRPVVLEGNVTSSDFGLNESDIQWISNSCGRILHNAAILQFFGPCRSSEPWTTNVGGTANAIDLAKKVGIDDFHYVSTAYVCGDRADRIEESDFDYQQSFRNDYEHSKFEAEKLVRNAGFPIQPTIYRPVVISGDSESGYTSTYHGLYLYLRMIALLVPQQERDADGKIVTRINLPMTGNEPRNIVPVDWISEVMTHLMATTKAHGKTFHLAPESGITPNQLVQYCYDYFGSTGVEFGGDSAKDRVADNEFANKVFDAIKIYEDYETSDPDFDRSNLQKYAGHLDCPELSKNVIHRYLDFGENDRWGRAKKPTPTWEHCGETLIRRICDEIADMACDFISTEPDSRSDSKYRFRITFDLLGPGGGAWTVQVNHNAAASVVAGIPSETDVTLQMNVQRLQQWMSSDLVARRRTTERWIQRAEMARNSSLTD